MRGRVAPHESGNKQASRISVKLIPARPPSGSSESITKREREKKCLNFQGFAVSWLPYFAILCNTVVPSYIPFRRYERLKEC